MPVVNLRDDPFPRVEARLRSIDEIADDFSNCKSRGESQALLNSMTLHQPFRYMLHVSLNIHIRN